MPSQGSFPLNPDFADLLRALSEEKARFLVVGAFAVAVHAEPRTTGDLDVWVEATRRNAERVYTALRRFGAPLDELSIADLMRPDVVFQMGVVPNRIDVLTSITGVTFGSAWRGRVRVRFGDVLVPVLGRSSLLRNKRATGRDKDLLDVDRLARFARARGRGPASRRDR
ncbi:MAG: hypothetical protein FJ144_16340 [Deltaproteobacteria bacterium]|nr:hypothetical protein [Deltaproteobacteria bacterium]